MGSYFVVRATVQSGPFEEVEIVRQIQEGLLSPDDVCWKAGMADWRPIATVITVPRQRPTPTLPISVIGQSTNRTQDTATAISNPVPFLYISNQRFVVSSLASFGMFDAYWIYKNWRYVKERDKISIYPFWRGIFAVFFCHSLLRRIRDDELLKTAHVETFDAGTLATTWVILRIVSGMVSNAAAPWALIVGGLIPTFLCLLPAQRSVNNAISKTWPDQKYHKWSVGQIIVVSLGLLFWVTALYTISSES